MYKFVTHTWNPLGGKCPHGCSYCSTGKLMRWPAMQEKYSGEVRLYEKELKTNLGSGRFIFVCAQHDLFAEVVPDEYINKILSHCAKHDGNKYLFQSKNPGRMNAWLRLSQQRGQIDSVVCTTIETNRFYPEIMRSSPPPGIRAKMMSADQDLAHYVTIEPIMDF
ncbi:MAG: phage Gp37/Gp68 family protein, partial [Candidatus Omnitrophica bacterium]|nr:phage Gp37/Gp68 family protein [Candidatus Omnitrophota bacterium]